MFAMIQYYDYVLNYLFDIQISFKHKNWSRLTSIVLVNDDNALQLASIKSSIYVDNICVVNAYF